ncbi:transposase [Candidatus Enterovibrio escicola]
MVVIVFIHTYSGNGNYNPHLHVILVEGAFFPSN